MNKNMVEKRIVNYKTSRSINSWWNMGFMSVVLIMNQIITGGIIGMRYEPKTRRAQESIEEMKREGRKGWIWRKTHSIGGSLLWVVVYIHVLRGLKEGMEKKRAYKIGYSMMLMLMGTAFIGYVLPGGQMSVWGATVIISLLTGIPIYGTGIVKGIWGGYTVGTETMKRAYVLHVILPIVILIIAEKHVKSVHKKGGENATRTKIEKEGESLYELYWYKDIIVGLIGYIGMVGLIWSIQTGGKNPGLKNTQNMERGNTMETPEKIEPEWYFLPWYAILRSSSKKTLGMLLLGWSLSRLLRPGLGKVVNAVKTKRV